MPVLNASKERDYLIEERPSAQHTHCGREAFLAKRNDRNRHKQA